MELPGSPNSSIHRVIKAGARLLADYLEYARSGGTAVGASGSDELNPFEAGVRDRLAGFGITVVPQYGVGGYRIDFVAAHPQDPDRKVLASPGRPDPREATC